MAPILTILLGLAVQLPATGGAAADTTDAYLDPGARTLLIGARSLADSSNASIEAFRMVSRRRISVGLRTARRDRLLYKLEEAWRVSWRRMEEWRVEVLGSREIVPLVMTSPDVGDLEGDDGSIRPETLLGPTGGSLFRIPGADDDEEEEDDDGLRHPLAPASEADYRFASGDTTRIRLADGRVVTLIELRVIPRRAHAELLSGSFWLEAGALAPVRGIFALAAPARLALAGREGGVFAPLPLPDASFQLDYVTIDYGLWEGRWWMPRLVALEGSGRVGGVTVPLLIEQSFEEYRIFAANDPWEPLPPVDTLAFEAVVHEAGDDSRATGQPRTTVVPRDTGLLVASPHLPASIFEVGGRLVTESDLDRIGEVLGVGPFGVAHPRPPRLDVFLLDPSGIRYNRVEGLAIGSSARIEMMPFALSASAGIGIADPSPSFEITAGRDAARGWEELNFYRRLESFSPWDRPFSLASSLSAALFGRDDGDYYRALGTGLTAGRTLGRARSVVAEGGIYVERQRSVEKGTDASLAHWTRDRLFRENPAADGADQVGGELSLRLGRGLDPLGFRGVAQLGGRAETGTFRFVAPFVTGYAGFPLPGPVLGSIEVATGTIFGDPPVQRLWYVGGSGTVRGIRPENREMGSTFWRGRAELANQRPAVRLVLFTDAGWAGERNAFTSDPSLLSAGVGISTLDGLLRADLAHLIRGGSGWGVQLYLDAPL